MTTANTENQPTDFNTRFAQLWAAHDGREWYVEADCLVRDGYHATPLADTLPSSATVAEAETHHKRAKQIANQIALAHNLMPELKDEIDQAAKEAELRRQEFNLELAKRREAEQKLESQASELTEARARIEEQEKHIADLNHDMEEMHKAMNEGYGIAFESGYDCAENQ